jgi:tyrosine-protein kinase Etk/Wzc
MNFKKEYQQIIAPLIKSSPIIIGLIVIAVLVMKRAVTYMTPEYRASGAIKINNLSYSQASFMLFGKEEGSLPKQNENFLTEVEVFQTRDLIEKTLHNLNWELSIYRVGKLSLDEIYEERPFEIEYSNVAQSAVDKPFHFDFIGDGKLRFRAGGEQDSMGMEIRIGDSLALNNITFTIKTREDFLKYKPHALRPGDRFAFKINSMDALVAKCSGKQLFVKPVEKDVSIIQIYFNHELPEKAQMFVNELMRTYIEEGRLSKEIQADETLEYLDRQLDEVTAKLREAESELAYFRSANRLINTTQETDATLKELTQLDLQKVDLEMKTSELKRLHNHLWSGNYLSDFSPNFEALQDPIFRESYLKAQSYETLRKDLLQKYTPQNPQVTNLEEKIKEVRSFLNESVNSTMSNLGIKKDEVDKNIALVGERIKNYPEKERRLVVLEREVSLNENMYNYLVKKRTELAIGKSSDMYPHKIIEHAERPKSIASPNKSLLYGLAVLMALMLGMVYAYLRSYVRSTVEDKSELESIAAPVIGVVYKKRKKQTDEFDLVSGLVASLKKLPPSSIRGQGQLFVTTSMVPGEGKSFTSAQLAKAFAASGRQVLLVDMDVRKPSLHYKFGLDNTTGYCDILEKRIYALNAIQKTNQDNLFLLAAGHLKSNNYALLFSRMSLDFIYDFRWHFDVVIVDTPPTGLFEDSLPLMNESTANLFVLRRGFTKRKMLGAIGQLLAETQIPNIHLVLNDVKCSDKVAGYKEYVKKYYSQQVAAGS